MKRSGSLCRVRLEEGELGGCRRRRRSRASLGDRVSGACAVADPALMFTFVLQTTPMLVGCPKPDDGPLGSVFGAIYPFG
jgi:hypothetical protein